MVLLNFAILVASLVIIGVVSEKLVNYVIKLSKVIGISEIAAGFILLSVSTSLPELAVSAIASYQQQAGLSVGNVLGSNIANITIILAMAVFLSGSSIVLKSRHNKDLVKFLFITSIIPFFIFQRGSLGPVLGAVLLILFLYFNVALSKEKSSDAKAVFSSSRFIKDNFFLFLKFLTAMILVIIFSKTVVDNAVIMAESIGIPASIIGATLVAFGTSLPELVTSIQALRKRLYDLALGNLLGSCITNITLVLGVSSFLSTSSINTLSLGNIMFYVLLSSLTLWYFISTSKKIDKRKAAVLLIIYALFILQELGISVLLF